MAMSTSRYPEIADAIRTPERRYQAKRKRILVVEDDRLSLIVLRQLLTAQGHEILHTSDTWRAVLFMIVPPGLIAMGFVWISLAGNTAHTRARLDWTGFVALSIAMIGLQLLIDRGQRLDWFE